ncbi:RHS repeat domain-containing protein [Paenibacillus sp. A3]|uniref:RHS repeat domain-containing protein n=1 Tax=Paenibacillus sp. A3 TaxID=1337054 RepID=UPI001ED99304|nr:RHS repeat domain-containing protein [Paenibacillus sp. A3]
MSKVVRPDGQEVTFTYDSLGRRIEKHFNGVVHCYVWDGNIILLEWKAEKAQAESGGRVE